MTNLRIGLTSRMIKAPHFNEWRDALAQDWARQLPVLVPDGQWVALPNIGADVVDFAKRWSINAVVLTGGDDIGRTPARDETETRLLDYALESRLPVLGVCRGLQFLQHYFGGTFKTCSREAHVNVRHEVISCGHLSALGPAGTVFTVNSYHEVGIAKNDLVSDLQSAALARGGEVEAAIHRTLPVIGVMWHPERNEAVADVDVRLFRDLFGKTVAGTT